MKIKYIQIPKKILDAQDAALSNGQKIFNEWLIEKTKQDKNGNN